MGKYLFLLITIFLLSCTSNKQTENNQPPAVPEALQDHKKSASLISKERKGNDLVEDLYEEKLKQFPELQAIEKRIKELRESKIDSTETFHVFKNKNLQYYQSAESHKRSIQDSLLKKEIDAALSNSKLMFENRIAELERLEDLLEKKAIVASDRYQGLKIYVSLGMMEQYQKENTPSAKSMNSIVKDYDKLIFKLDSAINKNK